jgi:hypothetical protein
MKIIHMQVNLLSKHLGFGLHIKSCKQIIWGEKCHQRQAQ